MLCTLRATRLFNPKNTTPLIRIFTRGVKQRISTKPAGAGQIDSAQFHASCRYFQEFEEDEMKIKFENTNDLAKVDLADVKDYPLPASLLLPNVAQESFFEETPNVDLPEPKSVGKVICQRVYKVMYNNYLNKSKRDEMVDSMTYKILENLEYDDENTFFRPKPPLDLRVGEHRFATINNFGVSLSATKNIHAMIVTKCAPEVRGGKESMHPIPLSCKTSFAVFRRALLQTACGMMAAAQDHKGTFTVHTMYGVLTLADSFVFVYSPIQHSDLDAITNGNKPANPITFYYYPTHTTDLLGGAIRDKWGLRFSKQDERKEVLNLLMHLKTKIVSLAPPKE